MTKKAVVFNLVVGLHAGPRRLLVWQDEEGMKVTRKGGLLVVFNANDQIELEVEQRNVSFVGYKMLLFPDGENDYLFPDAEEDDKN